MAFWGMTMPGHENKSDHKSLLLNDFPIFDTSVFR